ncbi:hypothetical protein M9H77_01703 [Catharanthus roseus]|uniref:Uncharacterized protein n=1 Tax=Catharanthus roseus TaxID=4058 RepID=A0ACC0C6B3_CATRO|nr:hypothetical protein M9H77_01703 [Catharanthus roseus]
MEEVPAHVHPGPIVPDVLSRQHEHRFGLIWSGDHETCYTDLQYRRFGRNLFQCYSTAPLKRGARRQPGHGAGGGRLPVPLFPHRHGHVDPGHVEMERGKGSGGGQPTVDLFDSQNLDFSFSLGLPPVSQSLPSGSGTSQTPPPPGLGFASFQTPHSTSFGFYEFRAPPPSGIAGSSTPHQPIS